MKKLKSTLLVLLMAMICLVAYYLYIAVSNDGKSNKSDNETAQEESTTEPQQGGDMHSEPAEAVTVSLVAVGDNFTHESVINSGRQADGTYNYDFLFADTKSFVEAADIAVIFQTMIIAGNDKGVSGYPVFNAPEEMITAIDNAGFDVALMASNHSNDKGTDGIRKCISLWNEKSDILALGINDNEQEAVNIPILEIKGKKVAILNYTTDMNSPITSPSEQYMVNYLGALNSATGDVSSSKLSEGVLNDIRRADDQADFVVVFPYWGTEYNHKTSDIQKAWAKSMTEAGADLIIGARSHYIGEIEEITADNGNTSMCYYSLGNFCSSFNDADAMVGGMARVNIVFDGDRAYVDTENSGIMPIVTQYSHSGNAGDNEAKLSGVFPISAYTPEMASSHGIITRAGVKFSMELIDEIINGNIDSKYLISE